jgi:hypothetical protein
MENKRIGVIGHVSHGSTIASTADITPIKLPKQTTSIIADTTDTKSYKITNEDDNIIASMLYANATTQFGKKRGTNLTPKKKKRKK